MSYIHTEIVSPLLLHYQSKWRDTTYSNSIALPLHFLTVSLTESQRLSYNATIQYTSVLELFPFIRDLPWENTLSHPIPWVCKLLANKNIKNFSWGILPRTPFLDDVSSVPPWGGWWPPSPPSWDECTVKLVHKHN